MKSETKEMRRRQERVVGNKKKNEKRFSVKQEYR